MSQTEITQILPKGLGNIQFWRDLGKGLYYACAGAILKLLYFLGNSILQEHPHFPVTWAEWFPYVQGIAFAASGYVLAKFGINNVGQIGKADKNVIVVSQEYIEAKEKEINDLKAKISKQ